MGYSIRLSGRHPGAGYLLFMLTRAILVTSSQSEGAWNRGSSTRVAGNSVDGSKESARQCSFEAPVDPKTNQSTGRAGFPSQAASCAKHSRARPCSCTWFQRVLHELACTVYPAG